LDQPGKPIDECGEIVEFRKNEEGELARMTGRDDGSSA